MSRKLTQEEAKAKDPPEGPWLVGEYKGTHTKIEYKCPKCNKIFLTRPTTVAPSFI